MQHLVLCVQGSALMGIFQCLGLVGRDLLGPDVALQLGWISFGAQHTQITQIWDVTNLYHRRWMMEKAGYKQPVHN